ncbi:CorA-like Mg2+ transporter protein [Candidatus Gugararchaeum adminiculabundum]|nr:CorA-like Mg2+ transporter protein [Candidatus Gugararchaeum adminiculabundum]
MIYTFESFEEFQAKAAGLGIKSDLAALTKLSILFFEYYTDQEPNYIVMSLLNYPREKPNTLLVITRDNSLIYPKVQIENDAMLAELRKKTMYAESTLVGYSVLKQILGNYLAKFEEITKMIDELDERLEFDKVELVSRELKRFRDKVDDLLQIILRIEEKEVKLVDNRVLAYEFDILIAKTRLLADRCRSKMEEINVLRDKCDVIEAKILNKRLEKLTDIMKKLTAFTVIMMIPNIISSHFGMNFKYMPELSMLDAYPVVIAVTLLIMGGAVLLFKKWEWL